MNFIETVRGWTRKCDGWNFASPIQARPERLAEIETLPTFPAGRGPMYDFVGERPQYFIAVHEDGRRFLVDTEGYRYARYITELPVSSVTEVK